MWRLFGANLLNNIYQNIYQIGVEMANARRGGGRFGVVGDLDSPMSRAVWVVVRGRARSGAGSPRSYHC